MGLLHHVMRRMMMLRLNVCNEVELLVEGLLLFIIHLWVRHVVMVIPHLPILIHAVPHIEIAKVCVGKTASEH